MALYLIIFLIVASLLWKYVLRWVLIFLGIARISRTMDDIHTIAQNTGPTAAPPPRSQTPRPTLDSDRSIIIRHPPASALAATPRLSPAESIAAARSQIPEKFEVDSVLRLLKETENERGLTVKLARKHLATAISEARKAPRTTVGLEYKQDIERLEEASPVKHSMLRQR